MIATFRIQLPKLLIGAEEFRDLSRDITIPYLQECFQFIDAGLAALAHLNTSTLVRENRRWPGGGHGAAFKRGLHERVCDSPNVLHRTANVHMRMEAASADALGRTLRADNHVAQSRDALGMACR